MPIHEADFAFCLDCRKMILGVTTIAPMLCDSVLMLLLRLMPCWTRISSLGAGCPIWNVRAAILHRFKAPYKPFAATAAEADRCSGRLQCASWIYCCTAGRWSCGVAAKIVECYSIFWTATEDVAGCGSAVCWVSLGTDGPEFGTACDSDHSVSNLMSARIGEPGDTEASANLLAPLDIYGPSDDPIPMRQPDPGDAGDTLPVN
ncbi:hypothetical protein Nepgr_008009 [Nepenthes gracilis]|uniref:Uncharacterized protein n=1 Tax=Nepenthes gracilis TaxID=150966 RepID=A0AAD3S851_NEPGR|nr:hypothetical protein Nepgr_008009 [Nepenthes gracilis]